MDNNYSKIAAFGLAFLLFTGAGQQQALNVTNMAGGLNTQAGALATSKNEASKIQNIHFTNTGSIVKRKGSDLFGSALGTSDEVTMLADYRLVDGNNKIVAISGTSVFKTDGTGDGTWNDITSGETVTADFTFDFVQFRNILAFTNGNDPPLKWDQPNAASDIAQFSDLPTGLTKAKHLEVFKDFTFFCNVTVSATAHPSRCYYSAPGEIDTDSGTWTDSDFFYVGRDKGEGEITMVEALGDRMVVGKEFGAIYNVFFTGNSNVPFINQKSFSQVGAGSAYANVVVRNVLFFWSTDGLGFYAYDGQNSIKISDKISPTIQDLAASRFAKIVGAVYPKLNQIWWTLTDNGTTNETALIYDYENKSWTVYKGVTASYATQIENGNIIQLWTGDYNGRIVKHDVSDDDVDSSGTDGAAIDAFYKSGWLSMGNPAMTKSIDHIIVYSQVKGNWNLTVGTGFDFLETDKAQLTINLSGGGVTWSDNNWSTFNWSTTEGGKVNRLDYPTGRGRVVRVNMFNRQADEPFVVEGYSVIYKDETLF